MLRLTEHDPHDDVPESYPFPTQAARLLRRTDRYAEASVDPAAATAARRVEQAMESVELRFKYVREALGLGEPDPNRPRAA
jgi:hypothetical protein